jgi:hypothetical protein
VINPLAALDPYRWLIGVVLVGGLWLAHEWDRKAAIRDTRAAVTKEYEARASADRVAQLTRINVAMDQARRDERAIIFKQQENRDEKFQAEITRARADAATAGTSAERLRQRFAALAASAASNRTCVAGPAAPAGSAPAHASADLLSDVQRRIDEAAGLIAAYADAARPAGLLCERDYDALRDAHKDN